MNILCQNCKRPITGQICQWCGSAIFRAKDVTVCISAVNYSSDRLEEISMNILCQNCKRPITGQICQWCGSAIFRAKDVTVCISAVNYSSDRLEEISMKFMSPLIQGTIRQQTDL
ncbi:hypothetical protein HA075_24260 [bacterium BFN5]|nr:hypothetical protein HA075_24260 [bacterium BFN5]